MLLVKKFVWSHISFLVCDNHRDIIGATAVLVNDLLGFGVYRGGTAQTAGDTGP